VSEDAGIEPRTVSIFSLAVRRSIHKVRSHPLFLLVFQVATKEVFPLPVSCDADFFVAMLLMSLLFSVCEQKVFLSACLQVTIRSCNC